MRLTSHFTTVAFAVLLISSSLLAGSTSLAAAEPAAGFEHFVTTRDAQLYDGPQRLRFVSWNIPNLIAIEDALEFLGESPWRWPDEFEIADALETIRQMDGRVARTYVITVRREGSDMGDNVHVLAPGQFNEDAFVALDRVLQIANEKQVRIILPLVDNWKWMGGVEQYAAFRGKDADEFWSDPQLIDDFKATVRHVVTRRNTLTGQLYSEDKAILAWETGNEVDATPDWTAQIAAYIKQLDGNHLVIDGRSLHGVPEASLTDPNVDVVTTHHYPGPGRDIVAAVTAAAATARGKKAYFVGEVGFIPVEEATRVFDAAIDADASGALYWSLRFHRREGGFYWHSEASSRDLHKAYHWPGFDSGEPYRERELLHALLTANRRIGNRGIDAAARPAPPAPARLLPIAHPGRIAWQGSAGASGYDVQRAHSESGPWQTVGDRVSDADTPYRPLFCDGGVEVGHSYWYRVIAKNSAGAAEPSNVVGPVAVNHMLLVDELCDQSLLSAVEGNVELRSNQARRAQEDLHRMELAPGGALVYRLPSDAAQATVWLFAEEATPACEIHGSSDGKSYEPLPARSQTTQRGAGDYGYLQPVLLTACIETSGIRHVKVVHVGGADAARFQASRIEIRHSGGQAAASEGSPIP